MFSVHLQCVLETAVQSAPTVQCIKLSVRCKLVFTGIAVSGGCIRILRNTWKKNYSNECYEMHPGICTNCKVVIWAMCIYC